jgi:hypothetical protein
MMYQPASGWYQLPTTQLIAPPHIQQGGTRMFIFHTSYTISVSPRSLPIPTNSSCTFTTTPSFSELNSLLIIAMVTVGFYQALCNMYRVFFSFDYRTLPPKVGARRLQAGCEAQQDVGNMRSPWHVLCTTP